MAIEHILAVSGSSYSGDSPLILISSATYTRVTFVVSAICTPTLCFAGLIGNGIGITILRKDSKLQSTSFQTYMFALMICHIFDALVGITRSVPHIVAVYDYVLGNFLEENIKRVLVYTGTVINHLCAFIMIVLSIERLFAIIRPFTFREIWTAKHPKILMLASSIIISFYLLPYLICFKMDTYINFENKTLDVLEVTEWCVGLASITSVAETITLHYLALTIILGNNFAIIIAHRRNVKELVLDKPSVPGRRQQHTRLTVMIICMMILYVLMSLPLMFAQTVALFDNRYYNQSPHRLMYYFFVNIANTLSHINTACDSLIYICISGRIWYKQKRRYFPFCCVTSISRNQTPSDVSLNRSTPERRIKRSLSSVF